MLLLTPQGVMNSFVRSMEIPSTCSTFFAGLAWSVRYRGESDRLKAIRGTEKGSSHCAGASWTAHIPCLAPAQPTQRQSPCCPRPGRCRTYPSLLPQRGRPSSPGLAGSGPKLPAVGRTRLPARPRVSPVPPTTAGRLQETIPLSLSFSFLLQRCDSARPDGSRGRA